ncbi:ATP-binding protein [Bradyrhizobium iriomotense]|uniref:ATPase n=1 Tax=Bradyrhizobium iriomotense TaxID=441950 RepID=A0ABQ6B5Q5_9BRAD|nr:AAA family ATPase [Bradyrhizobium iriomotense]GLR87951.1 ATPase [Bradyrhizobium iriomotense]
MTAIAAVPRAVLLNPDLGVADAGVAWWLDQVTLRLRREVAWCWHLRGEGRPSAGGMPPFADSAAESLDLTRYIGDKRAFFATDVAARHLSERLAGAARPAASQASGSWDWIARQAGLDDAAQFVLALALAARLDAALGPVFACCHNDPSRTCPTLALAQRLWDEPRAVTACADPAHPLRRYGLLSGAIDGHDTTDWMQPLDLSPMLVGALADPASCGPAGLVPVSAAGRRLPDTALGLVARLATEPPSALQIVALAGSRGADIAGWAAALAASHGRRVVTLAAHLPPDRAHVQAVLALCWLRDVDLVVPDGWQSRGHAATSECWFAASLSQPVRCYVAVGDGMAEPPASHILPTLRLPAPDYADRVAQLTAALGSRAAALDGTVREAARRFRLDDRPLANVAHMLRARPGPLSATELIALCRAEAGGRMGALTQPVVPRFTLDELVLPKQQAAQLQTIADAMRALTRVHYEWGTARVWNESGLSVLFCGSSGTGKTMAAEALAQALNLPLYRIDLSQVVNKYIGETEKNLARIFDAAEESDSILFFDEADALFGKRTDVRDAHDRFANIEISYLLERMERFKGLAILATNRRKDLDDAFTRRLRYVVEFPLPGLAERERIWRQVFPGGVDVGDLDFGFLAGQFELAGGHIRSAAFNACLSRAAKDSDARLTMADVLVAIRRELDKLDRISTPGQFGRYADLVRDT